MLDREICITIPGDPATKGSLRCVGRRGNRAHVLIEQLTTSGPWREKVAGWVRLKVSTEIGKGEPLGAEITFTVRRPPSHYGTGRNADKLKATSPAYPTGHNTGDIDKLLRLILDALQDAGTIPDDAQVVEVVSRKLYPAVLTAYDTASYLDGLPYPGVRIRLYPMT